MTQPWLDPVLFWSLYGGVGGVGGTIIGIAGGLGGDQARRGKLPKWVGSALYVLSALGALAFLAGSVALLAGQPPYIWLALIIGGVALGCFPIYLLHHLKKLNTQVSETERAFLEKEVR